jgi:tetratricopeptide (TPR) repeat protein
VVSEKSGDWKTAAAYFSKAIELNPFLAKAYYRLAAAEDRLGLRDQAIVHRKKSKEINEARGQFPAAYSGYLTDLGTSGPGSSNPATAARRIAAICETLGWSRAASAWNRLAVSP